MAPQPLSQTLLSHTVIDVLTSMTVFSEGDRHREIVSMTVCEEHRHRRDDAQKTLRRECPGYEVEPCL
jgi:hypothetical protein